MILLRLPASLPRTAGTVALFPQARPLSCYDEILFGPRRSPLTFTARESTMPNVYIEPRPKGRPEGDPTPQGARNWVLRYMLNGRPGWMGLGPLALYSLAEARANRCLRLENAEQASSFWDPFRNAVARCGKSHDQRRGEKDCSGHSEIAGAAAKAISGRDAR